jgi:hypothetical protein
MARKRIVLGVIAAVGLAGAARAETDTGLDKAFGSTIVSTYADGRQAELWLHRDGGYTAAGRRQDRSSGRWRVKDGKLCLSQQKPWAPPISYCTPLPDGGMDKAWSAKSVTGDPITVKLVKGLHGRGAKPTPRRTKPVQIAARL